MTELQKMYLTARAGKKRGHYGALRHISRQTGIDPETIDRCLKRARRAAELDARRAS